MTSWWKQGWFGALALACVLSAVRATPPLPNTAAGTHRAAADSAVEYEVFLVPHSHCDTHWKRTFEDYYASPVRRILEAVVWSLWQAPARRFTWADVSFLAYWMARRGDTFSPIARAPHECPTARRARSAVHCLSWRQAFVALVESGQLEVVHGGWVQHDEGLSTLADVLDMMELGQRYVLSLLGRRPQIAWQIDAFGHAGGTPRLLRRLGFTAVFLSRLPQQTLHVLRRRGHLEGMWGRPAAWQHGDDERVRSGGRGAARKEEGVWGDEEVLMHMAFDGTYAFPAPELDIESPRHMTAPLMARVQQLVSHVRRVAPGYPTRKILVFWGDDQRYSTRQNARGQFASAEELMAAINSDPQWRMRVRWATPSEYLLAAHPSAMRHLARRPKGKGSEKETNAGSSGREGGHGPMGVLPRLGAEIGEDGSGDALPYNDDKDVLGTATVGLVYDNYWSGYYGTRPRIKSAALTVSAERRIATHLSFVLGIHGRSSRRGDGDGSRKTPTPCTEHAMGEETDQGGFPPFHTLVEAALVKSNPNSDLDSDLHDAGARRPWSQSGDSDGLTVMEAAEMVRVRVGSAGLNHHDSLTGTCTEAVARSLLEDASTATERAARVSAALLPRVLRAARLDQDKVLPQKRPRARPGQTVRQDQSSQNLFNRTTDDSGGPGSTGWRKTRDADDSESMLGQAQLIATETGSAEKRAGGVGGGGVALDLDPLLQGGSRVIVVVNSLEWPVLQRVALSVVGVPGPGAGPATEQQRLCVMDGTGHRLDTEAEFEGQEAATADGASERRIPPFAGRKRGAAGALTAEGVGGEEGTLRFWVKVAALGYKVLVLGLCQDLTPSGQGSHSTPSPRRVVSSLQSAERMAGSNETAAGAGPLESRLGRSDTVIGTSVPLKTGPFPVKLPKVEAAQGGDGRAGGRASDEAGDFEVSVDLRLQRSSGVDGYGSGAYVMRSILTDGFTLEALILGASVLGLAAACIPCLFAIGRLRRRRRAPRGNHLLPCIPFPASAYVVYAGAVGAVLGFLLSACFFLPAAGRGRDLPCGAAADGGCDGPGGDFGGGPSDQEKVRQEMRVFGHKGWLLYLSASVGFLAGSVLLLPHALATAVGEVPAETRHGLAVTAVTALSEPARANKRTHRAAAVFRAVAKTVGDVVCTGVWWAGVSLALLAAVLFGFVLAVMLLPDRHFGDIGGGGVMIQWSGCTVANSWWVPSGGRVARGRKFELNGTGAGTASSPVYMYGGGLALQVVVDHPPSFERAGAAAGERQSCGAELRLRSDTPLPPNSDLFATLCARARGEHALAGWWRDWGGDAGGFTTDTGGLGPAGARHKYSFWKLFPGNLLPSSGPVSVFVGTARAGPKMWLLPQHAVGVTSKTAGCVDVLLQRRHAADDEKGLQEDLNDESRPLSRLWVSVGEGAGEETEEEQVWAHRVAMELRYPLRVLAFQGGLQGAEAGTRPGMESMRQGLDEAGLVWAWSPLVKPLPKHVHFEKFADGDGHTCWARRAGCARDADTERSGLGVHWRTNGSRYATSRAGCALDPDTAEYRCPAVGHALWVRNMRLQADQEMLNAGHESQSAVRDCASVDGEEIAAAFGLDLPTQSGGAKAVGAVRVGCSDVRPMCL